jgi:8-oxo-dGTP pyrophosphatase MutT (NUDIX family)
MNHIRPIAICVFLNNNRILVMEGYDPVKNEQFYRPLGGGIEFGENSKETICRELMEELNIEVDEGSLSYLGALENIFTFNGTPGHEIVLIYDGALKERRAYEQTVIVGTEANGEDFCARWKDLDEFGEGKSILYPDGLLDLLRDHGLMNTTRVNSH